MNNRIPLPNEIFIHTFSFLGRKPHLFSPLSLVCKHWHKIVNKDELWLQLIRPEFQKICKNSGSTAKEFYKNNIDARIDTFYLIGLPVQTAIFDTSGRLHTISVNKQTLLEAFPHDKTLRILDSRENAIQWADILSKVDKSASEHSTHYICHYRPIFTLQLNELTLTHSKLNVQNESFYQGSGRELLDDNCFEISSSQVAMQHSLFYKTGILQEGNNSKPSREEHHELILNLQNNQKHMTVFKEEPKQKCRIQ